jgi:hypothetical protein
MEYREGKLIVHEVDGDGVLEPTVEPPGAQQ